MATNRCLAADVYSAVIHVFAIFATMTGALPRQRALYQPSQYWHCRDGPQGPCITFTYGTGQYDAAHGWKTEGARTALGYCMSWTNNIHVDAADVWKCHQTWYHCDEYAAGIPKCFTYTYGELQYTPASYPTDNVTSAQAYCENIPGNENRDVVQEGVFGTGKCPALVQIETSGGFLTDVQRENKRLMRREVGFRRHQHHSQPTDQRDGRKQHAQFFCYPAGPEGRCMNMTGPWMDAREECFAKLSASSVEHTPEVEAKVFGNGTCPRPTYYCREGGVFQYCTSFFYDDGINGYGSDDFYVDSFSNARDFCLTWGANLEVSNFSEVFGTGPCPILPVYHCLDKLQGGCFNFSYGDREFKYTPDFFTRDDAAYASDYCVNMVNAQVDIVNESLVFGHGPCPSNSSSLGA